VIKCAEPRPFTPSYWTQSSQTHRPVSHPPPQCSVPAGSGTQPGACRRRGRVTLLQPSLADTRPCARPCARMDAYLRYSTAALQVRPALRLSAPYVPDGETRAKLQRRHWQPSGVGRQGPAPLSWCDLNLICPSRSARRRLGEMTNDPVTVSVTVPVSESPCLARVGPRY
jgi:hypothetical protein